MSSSTTTPATRWSGSPMWIPGHEGDQVSGGEKPPAGLYEPIRGFGKLWRSNPQVRNTLGWAAGPEQADFGIEQPYFNDTRMLYHAGVDRVFIFYQDGWAEDIARLY